MRVCRSHPTNVMASAPFLGALSPRASIATARGRSHDISDLGSLYNPAEFQSTKGIESRWGHHGDFVVIFAPEFSFPGVIPLLVETDDFDPVRALARRVLLP